MADYRLKWRGDQVIEEVEKNLAEAMTEIGLRVEGEGKKQLFKGHGVVTGTLRRSIHTATPGYNWSSDDVTPSPSTPERGGQAAPPAKKNGKLTIQVGSGLKYALWIEIGHHAFSGYHYLTNGLAKVKPLIPGILGKHKIRLAKRR